MRILAIALLAPLAGLGQGIISTVAGSGNGSGFTGKSTGNGGPAIDATLNPNGVAVDAAGNIYIADLGSGSVRKVNTAGSINVFAGGGHGLSNGVPATNVALYFQAYHNGLAVDKAGNVYFADNGNQRVVKVDTAGIFTTVAGNGNKGYSGDGGPATSAELSAPTDVAFDSAGNMYIADSLNIVVRKVDTGGNISTFAGNGGCCDSGDGGPATSAALASPTSLAVDSAGNVYIGDRGFNVVRKVNAAGIISTAVGTPGITGFAGDGGPATSALISAALGVAVDGSGNLYIADSGNCRIRKVDASTGIITTVAGMGYTLVLGDGGPPTEASFCPAGVALDSAGNYYIADQDFDRIRKVTVGATPPPEPQISANGVVNGASFGPGLVSGSWATIQGTNLSSVTDTWDNFIVNGQLPTLVDNVSVTIGGQPAYVYFVSATQINFIVPNLSLGEQGITVSNSGIASASMNVETVMFAPAFFAWPNNQLVATFQDFSYAAASGTFSGVTTTPAKPGETIILWGTGFGPTNPAAPEGKETPSTTTFSTQTLPTVTVNNVSATVYGAALAPGFAGLYQVAIQVPSSLGAGNWPVVATIGGVSSPTGLMLAVQ
jgi:uncharacterized protein (TIGR03437 family)